MKWFTIAFVWLRPGDDQVQPGFTRGTEEDLNTIRIWRLGIAFGVES